jgi:hypothetical protein
MIEKSTENDRTALPQDPKDKRRYIEYRYFLEVTQTDCRVAIEARFAHNKCERRYWGYSAWVIAKVRPYRRNTTTTAQKFRRYLRMLLTIWAIALCLPRISFWNTPKPL